MSQRRLFEHDPVTNTTKWFHYDDVEDQFTIETISDVTELVEINKHLQNEDTGRYENFHRVASIPINIYYELYRKFGDDEAAWKRWLNERDNRAFRTKLGRV